MSQYSMLTQSTIGDSGVGDSGVGDSSVIPTESRISAPDVHNERMFLALGQVHESPTNKAQFNLIYPNQLLGIQALGIQMLGIRVVYLQKVGSPDVHNERMFLALGQAY